MMKDTSITTHTTHRHITQNMDSSNSSSSWDEMQDDENTPQQDATDAHWIWQQLAAIDCSIFPCCYLQSAYVDSVGHNLKKIAQLIPAHKVFHLKCHASPELVLDHQILQECLQWRKRFNEKIKFQTECIWNASQENNKSQVAELLSRPKAINNSSDHGLEERASIDQFTHPEMAKCDTEKCINSLRRQEEGVKNSTGPSATMTTIHGGMEMSGLTGNLNSRLKSISLLDSVSSGTSSPPPPCHPLHAHPHPPAPPVSGGNVCAASASKSSYKLAWINQQSQSVTEVKELQGGPSKTGLPALVPPRKKSFSAAVASSPFYSSNNLQVRKACRSKNEPPSLDNCNSNNLVTTNFNTNNGNGSSNSGNANISGRAAGPNSSSCNGSREFSQRITLPPLSTAISLSSSKTSGDGPNNSPLFSSSSSSTSGHQLRYASNLSGQMNKKPVITPCSPSISIFSSPFSSDQSVICTSSPYSICSSLNCDDCWCSTCFISDLTTFDINSTHHMECNCTCHCQGLSSSTTLTQDELTEQMESCNIFYPIGTCSDEMETCSIIDVDEQEDRTTDTFSLTAELRGTKCHFNTQSSKTIGFPVPPSLVPSITSILKDKWEEKEQTN